LGPVMEPAGSEDWIYHKDKVVFAIFQLIRHPGAFDVFPS